MPDNTALSTFLNTFFPPGSNPFFYGKTLSGQMFATRRLRDLDQTRDCYVSNGWYLDDGKATSRRGIDLKVNALVIDDVEEKVPVAAAMKLGVPAAIVRTSLGSTQLWFRLSREVSPGVEWRTLWGWAVATMGVVPDAPDAGHIFRLPMGVNTKPERNGFVVSLDKLDPNAAPIDVNKIVGLNPPVISGGGPDNFGLFGGSGPEPQGPAAPTDLNSSAARNPSTIIAAPPAVAKGTIRIKDPMGLMDLIPNLDDDRNEWKDVGHWLWALTEGGGDGFDAFDMWSQRHHSYDADLTERFWKSIKRIDHTSGKELLAMAERADPKGFSEWFTKEAGPAFDDVDADEAAAAALGADLDALVEGLKTQAALASAVRSPGLVAFTPNHQQSAQAVLAALGGTVRLVGKEDWREFDAVTGRWQRWPGNHMLRVVVDMAEAHKQSGKGLGTRLSSRAYLGAVANLAAVSSSILAREGDFDADPYLLGVPSGVIDLRKGAARVVRPGLAREMVTNSTMVDPASPGATGQRWSRFLRDFTMGDAALEEWLQAYAGYCLTGLTREHLMPFFLGVTGGNGKSVFINTLLKVWGDYGTVIDKRLLFEKSGMGHLAPLADTAGRRLGGLMDVASGASWDIQMLKQLTGGDMVKADHKFGTPFTFRAVMKMMVSGQATPGVRAMDGGLARRLKVVPLNFKPRTVNLDMNAELEQEWPEILRWALTGLDLYWGFGTLPAVKAIDDETQDFIDEQDLFGQWIAETWVAKADGQERVGELFEKYRGWCAGKGKYEPLSPPNAKHMSRVLKARGVRVARDKTGSYVEGYAVGKGTQAEAKGVFDMER